jgi:hypothetical protein
VSLIQVFYHFRFPFFHARQSRTFSNVQPHPWTFLIADSLAGTAFMIGSSSEEVVVDIRGSASKCLIEKKQNFLTGSSKVRKMSEPHFLQRKTAFSISKQCPGVPLRGST